jgi:hypothetical protein
METTEQRDGPLPIKRIPRARVVHFDRFLSLEIENNLTFSVNISLFFRFSLLPPPKSWKGVQMPGLHAFRNTRR